MRRLLIALLVGCGPAWAQTVYESREPSGVPVFSDQPSPGAVEVPVSPPVVVPSGVPPAGPAAPAPEAQAAYASLSVTEPENEGSVYSNTGAMMIRVALEPALRADQGDVIAVTLNGAPVGRRFRSLTIGIEPGDWQRTLEAVEYQEVQVAVLDKSGNTLISSDPVRFYLRRHIAR